VAAEKWIAKWIAGACLGERRQSGGDVDLDAHERRLHTPKANHEVADHGTSLHGS